MSVNPAVVLVIPARYGASRFPGKPVALLAGKPVIQHVYERAAACPVVERILVATDDHRIREVVEGFGGTVVMTESSVRTGTDRVAAAARLVGGDGGDIVVNLQADEIPLHPDLIPDLVRQFRTGGVGMGTLKRQLDGEQDLGNPALVKVVTDERGDALYFSRAPIPYERDARAGHGRAGLHYLHLGIYIYTRETLLHLAELPTGPLEEAEKLEQLRALEHGIDIRVWETHHASLRIDRPEDLEHAALVLRNRAACQGVLADAEV